MTTTTERRWECEGCGGRNVQVCFPAWFYETTAGELEHVDTDGEATPHFYCEDCGDQCEVIDHETFGAAA